MTCRCSRLVTGSSGRLTAGRSRPWWSGRVRVRPAATQGSPHGRLCGSRPSRRSGAAAAVVWNCSDAIKFLRTGASGVAGAHRRARRRHGVAPGCGIRRRPPYFSRSSATEPAARGLGLVVSRAPHRELHGGNVERQRRRGPRHSFVMTLPEGASRPPRPPSAAADVPGTLEASASSSWTLRATPRPAPTALRHGAASPRCIRARISRRRDHETPDVVCRTSASGRGGTRSRKLRALSPSAADSRPPSPHRIPAEDRARALEAGFRCTAEALHPE